MGRNGRAPWDDPAALAKMAARCTPAHGVRHRPPRAGRKHGTRPSAPRNGRDPARQVIQSPVAFLPLRALRPPEETFALLLLGYANGNPSAQNKRGLSSAEHPQTTTPSSCSKVSVRGNDVDGRGLSVSTRRFGRRPLDSRLRGNDVGGCGYDVGGCGNLARLHFSIWGAFRICASLHIRPQPRPPQSLAGELPR